MTMMERMKARWGVGPWGVVAILVVFALTGMTVVWLKKPVLGAILPDDSPGWVRWGVYLVVIVPIYQIVLLAYGSLFGKFSFFWQKEKAMARLIARPFKRGGVTRR